MSEDSASSPDVTSPRRSGRKRLSTTMQIQGHTVLRKNNYKVTGIQYIFDDHEEDEPKESRKKPKTTSSIANPKKPRVESPAEARRKAHNDLVEASVLRRSKLRRSFLAKRVDLLKPFLEQDVVEKLVRFAERNDINSISAEAAANRVPVKQPKMIQEATLRDYQLKGLEFMVRMHEQNLAMILGDEMGLVRICLSLEL